RSRQDARHRLRRDVVGGSGRRRFAAAGAEGGGGVARHAVAHRACCRRGAGDVVEEVSGKRAAMPEADRREFWQVLNQYMGPILASAVLWMLFDIVVYSGILFGPSLIAQGLGVPPAIFSLVMSLVFIIPTALILSLFALDRLGRKPTQAIGMIMAAVMLTIFALYQDQLKSAPLLGLL